MNPLDWPEDYLWIRHPDGHLTAKARDELYELLHGERKPQDEIERLLKKNRKWFRIYLAHVIGEHVIEIDSTGRLPEWEPDWVALWES